jgi:hypothetical protein
VPDHHLDDEARLQRADSGVPGQSCGVRACTCGVAALPRWWGRGRSRVLLCWAVPPRTPRPRSPRGAGEQECLKAIAAEQKKERDRKFWGTK